MQLKKLAFRTLSLQHYLRFLQWGYFTAYHLGILRNSPVYIYHYFVKNLIRKGDYVLDIGANLGYYSKLFSAWVGHEGKVFAVEPVRPYNEAFRRATRKRKNIVLYPYALGTEEKEITMVAPLYAGYLHTGLPHVDDGSEGNGPEIEALAFRAEMKIPSRLFGDLEKLDYIKCDIEGFETTVLKDLEEVIRRHKPVVQVEVLEPNQPELLDFFRSLEYEAYQLAGKRLTKITRLPALIDGDFIFLPAGEKRFGHLIAQ